MPALTESRIDYRARALSSLSNLPPFSPVLNRLLATLSNEDVSFSVVGEIIEKDTVIAGNVLKLVNSALYGRRGEVTSVRHAASMLGMNKLRNAVLGMSMARLWNQIQTHSDWSIARFNLHSVGVAILSDLLAQRVIVDHADSAFLAGLFHDLGKLLIAIGLRQEFSAILTLYSGNEASLCECEREVIGVTHAELSAAALEAWKLPEPIRAAVQAHHNPDVHLAGVPLGMHSLSQVIHCADTYLNTAGISVEKHRSPADAPLMEPFTALGMGDDLTSLIEEFDIEYQALTLFFR